VTPVRGRSRRVAVLLVVVGALAALLAGTQRWVGAAVRDVPGTDTVSAAGGSVAAGVPALALVALAGAVVLLTAGPVARTVAAVLLLVAGPGITFLALRVLADPASALAPAVTAATGTRGGAAQDVAVTPWPVLAAVAGQLVGAGAVVALARGRSWPGPSRRYERDGASAGTTAAAAPAPAARNALDDWNALSRGEDPTAPGS